VIAAISFWIYCPLWFSFTSSVFIVWSWNEKT